MLSPRLRIVAALVALGAALLFTAFLLFILYRPSPVVYDETYGEASVLFAAERTVILFPADCIPVRWRAEGIQALKFDGEGVVGEGASESCRDEAAELQVQFQDGTSEDYDIEKMVLINQLPVRLLIVVTVGLAGFALWLIAWVMQPSEWFGARFQLTGMRAATTPQRASFTALELGVLVMLLLFGVALRVTYLSQPMRSDEAWSYVAFASQPLDRALVTYWTTNNHIFNTLLMHVSDQVFGNREWMLRLGDFFAGILMIAASFRVARALANTRVALWVAALVATSSPMILYATNARGYSILGLLFLLQIMLGTHLRRTNNRARWLLFALLGVYSLYTVPTAAYGLGMVYLWLGISIMQDNRGPKRRALLRSLILSAMLTIVLAGLLYLPVALYTMSQVFESNDLEWLNSTSWSDFNRFLERAYTQVLIWHSDYGALVSGLLWLGVAVELLIPARASRLRQRTVVSVLLWIVPFAFLYLVRPLPRVFFFLFPLYLIVAVAGASRLLALARLSIERLPARALAVSTLGVSLVLGVGVVSSRSVIRDAEVRAYHDAEGLAHYLARELSDRDVFVCGDMCWMIWYYLDVHDAPTGVAARVVREYEAESDADAAERVVFFVAGEPSNPEANEHYRLLPLDTYSAPHLLHQFGDTHLYVMERLETIISPTTARHHSLVV